MNQKTLIALGTFAFLCIIALFTLRSPEKGDRTGVKPRPIARMKAGDFDVLEITKGGATTTLKKEGDKFKITTPVAYAADDYAAKQAFEAMEKIEFGSLVTDQKAKHAEFEVGDGAVRVVTKKGDKTLADLVFGKAMNSYTMVRVTSEDKVWQAVGSMKPTFDKDTTAWRDKSITTFTLSDAEKLEIASKTGGKIVLTKDAKPDGGTGDDSWSVTESAVRIAELDKTVAPGIASSLASFKTNDFADGTKPEETGLGDPAYTITATLKGGKTAAVLIGGKKGEEDFYVKSADSPQVFLVKKHAVERLMKRPIEFRDKTVCNIAEIDLGEVAVTNGADSFTLAKAGTDWKATRPAGLDVDSTKTPSILGAFKELKATSFADDSSPKTTGLAKAKTITARSSDKKATCTLKVGDETADKQSYYLQKAGSPDVYLIGKWTLERIMKKVDDLKKPGTTANAAKKG